ncbi:MAG: prepilin-type N-terminal cleavage/methylation domain-containing protein [Solirubrobacterales bacterium]|nr:prepilin-type N-terminal cleavage/methylation domain-containing protein [Solirubrobacterales bacterium]
MHTCADIRHRDEGFTLVELLVGITVSMIVLLATLTSLDMFSSNAAQQTRITDANDQVRFVMDSTVTDLRGASVILNAGATDLAYSVPASSTTSRVERLCVASDQLYGSSTVVTGAPTAPTAACSTGTKIATLKTTANTAFTYDGASASATPALVKNVGLTFSLDASQAGRTAISTLRASAARRSAGTLPVGPGDIVPVCNASGALLTLSVSAADAASLGPLTVTYATSGGVSLGTTTGTSLQIAAGITSVVATVTNALGATNTISKDVECD